MNKILVLTRGIPASGKSTWTKEQIEKFPDAVRSVNKDSIREELHNGIWSKENEQEVIKVERERVEKYLSEGFKGVVVDNTHLGVGNPHIKYYRRLAKKFGYGFKIRDFYIGRDEAIKRDSKRDKAVGVAVIDKMIKMQGNGGYPHNPIFKASDKEIKKKAVIVDLDGTLAFMDGKRSPYDGDKVDGDRLNAKLNSLLKLLGVFANIEIILLSGRDGSCEELTKKWLKDKEVGYDKLIMRKEGDKRKDSLIKKELYHKHIEGKYNVLAVFDDRQQVVDMWRLQLNLPCYQTWYGNF